MELTCIILFSLMIYNSNISVLLIRSSHLMDWAFQGIQITAPCTKALKGTFNLHRLKSLHINYTRLPLCANIYLFSICHGRSCIINSTNYGHQQHLQQKLHHPWQIPNFYLFHHQIKCNYRSRPCFSIVVN